MTKIFTKTIIISVFIIAVFLVHSVAYAAPAPTCTMSFTPSVVKQGENSVHFWRTTGPLSGYTSTCDGVLGYLGGGTQNYTTPEFLNTLNAQEIINGTSNSGQVRPSKIGKGSCMWIVRGPGGINSCSATIEVVPNEIYESNDTIVFENPATFHLVGNEKVRACPAFSCGVSNWGTYNGDATIKKKQGDWYFVSIVDYGKNEYGAFRSTGSTDGWLYSDLVPKDILDQLKAKNPSAFEKEVKKESASTTIQEKSFLSPPAFGNWIKSIADRFGSGFTQGFLVALALLIILVTLYLIRKYRLISKVDFSWVKHHRTVGIASSLLVVVVVFFTVSNYYQKRENELRSFITTQQHTIKTTQKSVEGLSKKSEEESQQRIAQERAAKEIIQRLETKIVGASTNKTIDLASIVNQWNNIIAKIECDVVYKRESFISLGSGTALNMNGQIAILSNRHVLVPEDITPTGCRTKVPGSVSIYSGDDIRVAVSGEDWAVFYPNNIDSQIRNITATQPAMCTRKPSVGDSVVVLGYPSIGSRTSVTATEGIIAGYDSNYFITSAKVEQGNSGGAAILVKDNCLLGIPTFAQVGKVESLARILDISTVFR